MAIDLSELIEMRDALIRARAKGVRSLQLNGERVEFVSDGDFARRIAALTADIEALQGGSSGGFEVGYPTMTRGL